MASNEASSDEKVKPEPIRNLHVELPASFHQRIKMMCVVKDKHLKTYAIEALQEKVARDEAALKGGE